MEVFSAAFRDAVTSAFAAPVRVLATIHLKGDAFTRVLRHRPDVTEIVLKPATRDRRAAELAAELG